MRSLVVRRSGSWGLSFGKIESGRRW
jgi:hypothetical protein